MATLIENVNAVKAAFSDIKAAIAEKGVEVADGTPVTEYASLIASISGGSADTRTKYKYYRLTITDFRRSGTQQQFANIAEVMLCNEDLVNLCPITLGMVYTANSYYGSSTPDKAFDGSKSTLWESNWNSGKEYTNWIKAQFPAAVAISYLGIVSRQDTYNDYPAEFKLEGSNDDETYTELLSVSDITEWTGGEEKMYAIKDASSGAVTAGYAYYRWTVTDFRRSGSQLQFANIAEMKLYDGDGQDCCTQEGAEYTASSHDETTGETVDKAFDGDVSTLWHSDYTNAPSYTNWIKVHLPTATKALSLGLTTRSDWTFDDHPEAFVLEGSNDNKTFTTLFSITGCSDGWTRGVERVFSFEGV